VNISLMRENDGGSLLNLQKCTMKVVKWNNLALLLLFWELSINWVVKWERAV